MRGSVAVQSSARRSYKAVVMPTDALLTFGMLKLTSLILKSVGWPRRELQMVDWDGNGIKRASRRQMLDDDETSGVVILMNIGSLARLPVAELRDDGALMIYASTDVWCLRLRLISLSRGRGCRRGFVRQPARACC
jgi:hypothetical protein